MLWEGYLNKANNLKLKIQPTVILQVGFLFYGGKVQETLSELRMQIEEIDEKLVALMKRRIQVVHQIGKVKAEKNLPVRDAKREDKVIEHILSIPHTPMKSSALKELFQTIMRICREAQKPIIERSHKNEENEL